MAHSRLLLFVAAMSLVCPGDEAKVVKVDIEVQTEYIRLASVGDPPTSSALRLARVMDPVTKKPYNRSNDSFGCDPSRLRRSFRLETPEVLLGEPIHVEFRVELDGPGQWDETIGGNYRGLGRDGNFFFLMRHQDGFWVPDIFEGHLLTSFGGLGGAEKVKQGEPHSDWLTAQQWCAIVRPGAYDLYAFHWGGTVRTVGLRQRVEAALSDAMKQRLQVDEDGQLVERETRERPDGLRVEQLWSDRDELRTSPIATSIPGAVKAKLKGTAYATDYAHFTLTIRQGDDQERKAMVKRWTGRASTTDDAMPQSKQFAVLSAMALTRQDDFLAELGRRVRSGSSFQSGTIFLGLAMRDDPRCLDLLFEADKSEAIEALRFLPQTRVPVAIPKLIDLLTNLDHTTRAAAEEMLRRWTGQEFNHTWPGYNYKRPTLEEGRAMQTHYRGWWEQNKDGFQPRFR